MARGILIRESDLDPLVAVLTLCSTPGKVVMRFEEREALERLLSQVVGAREATPLVEVQRDRALRYEYGDDITAYIEATSQLRLTDLS